MAKISREQVDRVAAMARLSFSDDEAARIGSDLEAILDYVETLNELDTEGIQPMSHVIPLDAPMRDGTAFVVPKVIDGEDEG